MVWGGRIVSDSTLTAGSMPRASAFADNGKEQRLIRTIPRKGFRFVGNVNGASTGAASSQDPGRRHPELALPDRPAIAVLPFVNMSGDPEQEYFSDGISEDIITALSKLRWFFVIARNSSFTYKGKAVHMKQVADELGVRYVVEGSVRKGGDRVRITAQLNDAATGSHIWAERYDRDLDRRVRRAGRDHRRHRRRDRAADLRGGEFSRQRKPPNSMDAWDLVMRALSHYWRVTRQDNIAAQALLEKRDRHRPELRPGARPVRDQPHVRRPYGLDRLATAAPIAERAALRRFRRQRGCLGA